MTFICIFLITDPTHCFSVFLVFIYKDVLPAYVAVHKMCSWWPEGFAVFPRNGLQMVVSHHVRARN